MLASLVLATAACDRDPGDPGDSGDRINVVIAPDSALLLAGDTLQFNGAVLDRNDQPVSNAVANWRSSDPSIAAVTSTGRVVAMKAGVTHIIATYAAASDSARVRIIDRPTACDVSGGRIHSRSLPSTINAVDGPHILSDSIVITNTVTTAARKSIAAGSFVHPSLRRPISRR